MRIIVLVAMILGVPVMSANAAPASLGRFPIVGHVVAGRQCPRPLVIAAFVGGFHALLSRTPGWYVRQVASRPAGQMGRRVRALVRGGAGLAGSTYLSRVPPVGDLGTGLASTVFTIVPGDRHGAS